MEAGKEIASVLTRIITAIVLAIIAILALRLLTITALFWLIWVLLLWLAFEWAKLAGLKRWPAQGLLVALVGLPLCLWVITGAPAQPPGLEAQPPGPTALLYGLLLLSALWWSLALVLIFFYPRITLKLPLFWSAIGWLLLTTIGVSFVWLGHYGVELIIYLLCVVAATDTAAYFAGKYLGKNKLAAQVSPKKTWEGVFAGLLAALAVVIILGLWLLNITNWPLYLVVSLLLAALSVVGDLTESLLKRIGNSKDSGDFLPGHGGLLDRADGFLATTPYLIAVIQAGYFPAAI